MSCNRHDRETEVQDWLNCVGIGWWALVRPLIDICLRDGIEIVQIKEKFGGLRFYVESWNLELCSAIVQAERLSTVTCEFCGKPGKIKNTGKGWLKCLCENCGIT